MRRRAIVVGFLSCIGVFALHAAELQITAASDVVDGDVSSIAALMARPGSDGISIREALEAAVGTPGPHVIRFSQVVRIAVPSVRPRASPLHPARGRRP